MVWECLIGITRNSKIIAITKKKLITINFLFYRGGGGGGDFFVLIYKKVSVIIAMS